MMKTGGWWRLRYIFIGVLPLVAQLPPLVKAQTSIQASGGAITSTPPSSFKLPFTAPHLASDTNGLLPFSDTSFAQKSGTGLVGFDPASYSPHQLIWPGVFIGAGLGMDLIQGFKNTQLRFQAKHLAGFHSAVDNTLLYLPAIIPYAMDLAGIRSKTDIQNRTAILIKGEILVMATGYLLKHTIHEMRPDRSNAYSFPSGHALQVFATATLLSEEYRDSYPWMPYAAYGLATGVGLLRVANNKHYLGDVLVGAGLGILAMKLSYLTHQYKWGKHKMVQHF